MLFTHFDAVKFLSKSVLWQNWVPFIEMQKEEKQIFEFQIVSEFNSSVTLLCNCNFSYCGGNNFPFSCWNFDFENRLHSDRCGCALHKRYNRWSAAEKANNLALFGNNEFIHSKCHFDNGKMYWERKGNCIDNGVCVRLHFGRCQLFKPLKIRLTAIRCYIISLFNRTKPMRTSSTCFLRLLFLIVFVHHFVYATFSFGTHQSKDIVNC